MMANSELRVGEVGAPWLGAQSLYRSMTRTHAVSKQWRKMMTIIGVTDIAAKPQIPVSDNPNPEVDWVTRSGMGLLYGGVAVSTATLVVPMVAEHWATILLATLGLKWLTTSEIIDGTCILLGTGAGINMTPAAIIAQFLWMLGAIMLCIQPFRMRGWTFLVFEVSMVLASMLPLLGVAFFPTVVLRGCYSVIVMLWLGSLVGMHVCVAMLPWHWADVWRRKIGGDTGLAILGSELLNSGYAMFGISVVTGWVGLTLGSIVMMRFGWVGMRNGIKIAVAWYQLNIVYVLDGVFSLSWIALKYYLPSMMPT